MEWEKKGGDTVFVLNGERILDRILLTTALLLNRVPARNAAVDDLHVERLLGVAIANE